MPGAFKIPNDVPMDKLLLITPPKGDPPLWDFDIPELARQMERFDIKLPIELKFHGRGQWRYGTHRNRYKHRRTTASNAPDNEWAYISDSDWHSIVINSKLNSTEANFTMWHELCHAIQSEQWAARTNNPIRYFYKEGYLDGVAYKDKFYERQAETFARTWSHIELIHERR